MHKKDHCIKWMILHVRICESEYDRDQSLLRIKLPFDEYNIGQCRKINIHFRTNQTADFLSKPFSVILQPCFSHFVTNNY